MSDDTAVLSLDLGSTWLKAAWVKPNGILAHSDRQVSPLRSSPLCPDEIWQSVRTLLVKMASSSVAPRKVLAVALTGVTRSHVFVDALGTPLSPLILWDDSYGEQQAPRVAAAYGARDDRGYGAFHPLARLMQFSDESGRAPHAMLELKDWLNFRLIGRMATDTVCMGRLTPDQSSGLELADVLAKLGIPLTAIPPSMPPTAILGWITANDASDLQALKGVPVATGSFDTWASTLGMGAIADGRVYDISGTTQVLGTFSSAPRHLPGMVSVPWTDELWQTGGPCQTGLGTAAWFARAFLDSDDPADTFAAAANSHSAELPLCLPYLSGERMPLWSSTLSASFHKVKPQHTRADFAQSLVEGLALAHRMALDTLGVRRVHSTIHMGGGGTRHSHWVQVRADAFGMQVQSGDSSESALIGSALAALVGLGHYTDINSAQKEGDAVANVIVPRPERAGYFDARLKEFSTMLNRDLSTL